MQCTVVNRVHRRTARFVLQPNEEDPKGKTDYRLVDDGGNDLPDFLRDEITFAAEQTPVLLNKILAAIYTPSA